MKPDVIHWFLLREPVTAIRVDDNPVLKSADGEFTLQVESHSKITVFDLPNKGKVGSLLVPHHEFRKWLDLFFGDRIFDEYAGGGIACHLPALVDSESETEIVAISNGCTLMHSTVGKVSARYTGIGGKK